MEFRVKINDQHGIAKTYIFLSLYNKNTKQYEKAIEYANKALSISRETKAILVMQNAANMLSDIYYEMKDYEKSLEFFRQFKTYNDSLLNDKKYSEIAKLQLQYKFEIEKRENEVRQQKIRFRYILVSFSLFLGLIILGLLFFLSRSRNRRIRLEKEKLESEMMVKNKELTTNVMYLLQKNEIGRASCRERV